MRCIKSNIQINCLNEKQHFALSPTGEICTKDNYQICFTEEEQEGCRIGSLKLNLNP